MENKASQEKVMENDEYVLDKLQQEKLTEISCRGDEVHMYPLSFAEFMTAYNGNRYDGWNEYITYGGIPLVVFGRN